MRVLVVGASGAIGTRLVPQLFVAGHDVVGTYNSPAHERRVTAAGATAVRLDVLDVKAVRKVVGQAKPDAIVHQATAFSNFKLSRNLDKAAATSNGIRRLGTDHLLSAAREHGVERFVAQSNTLLAYAPEGDWVKKEDAPLAKPPKGAVESGAAIRYLDEAVVKAGGIALRYGVFYGASNDGMPPFVKKRQMPIVGDGGGYWSWMHLDDGAAATVLALERGRAGIYHVVDDEPAPVRDWLPVLAQVLDAPPPRRIPTWLARLLGGEAMVLMMTQSRGASNEKAKRELGWKPKYPSWRQGFAEAYAAPGSA
ncbi:MAG: NAD-dependent epimerase/dehydratase family protein [Methanobacteriota archaeon]